MDSKDITTRIQEKARTKRYELLLNFCKEHNFSHLLFAHHLDDQIETILMREEKYTILSKVVTYMIRN